MAVGVAAAQFEKGVVRNKALRSHGDGLQSGSDLKFTHAIDVAVLDVYRRTVRQLLAVVLAGNAVAAQIDQLVALLVKADLGMLAGQYARRVVGRRMTAGGSTYMPLRVNMAGVIPIIFAAALMAFPPTVAQFFPTTQDFINEHFNPTDVPYILLQAFLIVIFTYFYTAVQFNPVDQADNLRKHGGYIPGIRPGPPTAQYLDRVLTRLTFPGALWLALVATLPTLAIRYGGFSQSTSAALGGTSILIIVGVGLDTVKQIQSQLQQRNYEGFLR